MSAYDCNACNISYPGSRGGGECPICKGQLAWSSIGTEDGDWEDRVLQAKGIFRASVLPELPRTFLSQSAGQTWIAGAVLESHGYPNAQPLDIIRVKGLAGELFFELVGRTIKDVPGTLVRGWLVEQVDWKGMGDDLTPEMFASFDGYTGGD